MSDDEPWNDEARENLRATLRWAILGEVRLAKRDQHEILDLYRAVFIDQDCPESERDSFIQFAENEMRSAVARVATEAAAWPEETDSDRLDRVEAALRDQGIVLWQASPCCDTCTWSDFPERIDEIDERHPGFRDRLRGYAFFIDQNLPESLSESAEISVYLAYGWISPDRSNVAPEEYEVRALGIAREVCQCLRAEGFEVDWNGRFSKKIGISLNWQRRTLLE